MEYRQLGESGLEVSVVTFGAWAIGGWMWGGAERKDAVEAIKASYDEGVTSIDTAPIYGQGLSEEIVGEAIRDIPREKVQILTKYGMRWDLAKGSLAMKSKDNAGKDIDIYKYAGKESIIEECENSLRRLGTDYIDLYQIHWHDETTPIEESMEAVIRLMEQGKVKAAGVCNYDVEQLEVAGKVIKLASNQVPYSMVQRRIEPAIVPYCREHDMGILAYSPLQRGFLTGKFKAGHHFEEGDNRGESRFYKPVNFQRISDMLDRLRPLAAQKNASLSQLVIRWTVERPGITVALVGARDAAQAIQNAKSINVKLSPEEMTFISTQVEDLELED